MKRSLDSVLRHFFARLLLLWGLAGSCAAQAAEYRLELGYPGDELHQGNRPKKTKLSSWVATQRWSALVLKDGALFVEPVTEATESDWVSVSGGDADRMLEGRAPKRSAKPTGISLKSPAGTIVLARLVDQFGSPVAMNPGQYASSVPSMVLREEWMASAEIAGRKWRFYTRHQKRPDGRLLAGSLEILADDLQSNLRQMVLLPPASGMAFAKQELLWLGDLDGDAEPDILLKRTLLSGHVDIVLVVGTMRQFVSHDPDLPASFFSSGVEPESNGFSWNRNRPLVVPISFASHGIFSVREEVWLKKLYPNATQHDQDVQQSEPTESRSTGEPPFQRQLPTLPVSISDRQFNFKGETIRFTMEYLPRVESPQESSGNRPAWGGDVVVRVFFRGKSQVLMEASPPDGGAFELAVGVIGEEAGIRVRHQPHYNNSFIYYWIYDKEDQRFRRLSSEQSQGC